MSRSAVTSQRRVSPVGGAAKDPWKRALVGLALLVLLMVAVSFISGRLKAGESAARALGEGEGDAAAAKAEGEAENSGRDVTTAKSAPQDSVGGQAESPAEGEAEKEGPEGETLPGSITGGEGETLPPEVSGQTPSLDLGGSLLKVFLGLAVVAALLLATRFVAARSSGRKRLPAGGRLEVVGYTRLGPASGIYEVRAGNRILMIGEAEKGLTLLGEVDTEALVEAEEAEFLEDEFLALLREEMAPPHERSESRTGKRDLLEELRWKTARRRRPAWR
ncbi:MAG: flagellar biosynthetic protein FliO [Actinomycetota bacterium]|nr:flagellar biosynthetic protein FliO [Actinomycetota bacterium]MDI7251172.1 flagellar biosynthetic protein FliO [Actinomycetota bacterium]